MKKVCSGCGQERNIEDFNWKYKAKGIHQSLCRLCTTHHSRKHYKNNKEIYVNRAHKRNVHIYKENRQLLYEYLTLHPCVDCGNNDPRVLEFDHVRGAKVDEVTRMVSNRASWNTIEREIAKCEVRCANCHRIKTSERGGWWRFHIDCSDE
jgi:hypothetical protein